MNEKRLSVGQQAQLDRVRTLHVRGVNGHPDLEDREGAHLRSLVDRRVRANREGSDVRSKEET